MAEQIDEVRSILDGFAAAWKTNDGPALGGFFTDDGTLVNPFGQKAVGRDAVSEMYTEYFKGMLAGTSTAITLDTVRDLGGERAFIDGEQRILAPDGSEMLALHLTALVGREGGSWKFLDSRPFTYAEAAPSG